MQDVSGMQDGLFALISILVLVAATAVAIVFMRLKTTTVFEWQRGLLYRNGKFQRELMPGRYRLGFGRTIYVMSLLPQNITIGLQEILTADRFLVKLNAVVTIRVLEARRAFESIAGTTTDLVQAKARIAVRNLAAGRTLEALLDDRPHLDAELTAALAPILAPSGIAVDAATVRDFVLAAEVRRMFTDVEKAKREGQAAIERARGEQAALRSLANAARMLKGNPELMNLRLLQALQSGGGKAQPTLVLGGGSGIMPIAVGPQTGEGEPQPEE